VIHHLTSADLSTQHGFVTDLFSDPEGTDHFLNDAQIAAFERDGFVGPISLLTETQVEALLEELDGFFDPDHPGCELWYEYHRNESNNPDNTVFHALGAWRIGPAFHDALWNPRFTRPASQLLGGAVRFWHDQIFCKPAHHGGPIAWHQDYSYWGRTAPMNHLTCWIALDDATEENGCIQYIPKSQRWDLLPMTDLAGDLDSIRDLLTDEQKDCFAKPVPFEAKAGQASFHHPMLLHGSSANRSNRPRRAMIINVILDGVRSLSDEPLLSGTPPIPNGSPLGGQFFPLLYDPASTSTPSRNP